MKSRTSLKGSLRLGCAATLGAAVAFCSSDAPRAQRRTEPEVKVTGIASRTSDAGAVVSISADGNLTRAQTWQDGDGFHVVLPKGQTALRNSGAPRNVRIQRVGDSLELILPVKPGASVTVQPRFNRLDLIVSGGARDHAAGVGRDATAARREAAGGQSRPAPGEGGGDVQGQSFAGQAARQQPRLRQSATRENQAAWAAKFAPGGAPADAQRGDMTAAKTPAQQANASAPEGASGAGAQAAVETAQAPPPAPQTGEGASGVGLHKRSVNAQSSLFSTTGLMGLMGLAGLCVGLFVYRRRREGEGEPAGKGAPAKSNALVKRVGQAVAKVSKKEAGAGQSLEQQKGDRRRGGDRRMIERGQDDRRKTGLGAESQAAREARQGEVVRSGGEGARAKWQTGVSTAQSSPSEFFGAFRVDQEVVKLAAGEAHSIEVLASRAADDRRAVETSLIKVMRSSESDEAARRRARAALEEYGFVARQSAALLLAPDVYERASAARVLGDVRSASSLPFLLEALYDQEAVVRSEVVTSLGALRLPRAIGPLIDVARRYPEMPASLLRPALSACSVETPVIDACEAPDETYEAPRVREAFTGEIAGLEKPEFVEVLPEWLEDDSLTEALERLRSVDVEARVMAAQTLAQYQVQRSVEALASMSACDHEPAVRAAAVSSLGAIDHESVFAPVLMALADEAREVRAAAARALSRLSFDRADAYVRVLDAADAETMRGVAQACVKAGLAAQALDRLTSEDRRQAYEAFALLALVVRGGETALVLEAVAGHKNHEVRLAAIKLLCMTGRQPELVEPFQRLADRAAMPGKVRAALLEAAARIEGGESASEPGDEIAHARDER